MRRMHIFYGTVFVLFLIILGAALYIRLHKKGDGRGPPEYNFSDLERGALPPKGKPANPYRRPTASNPEKVANPAKSFWQIYNNGVPVSDAAEDYAQVLLCLPSKNGGCRVPPADMFESFQTIQAGPYKFAVTDNFEFEFIVVLTFGGTFNLNGKNVGRYISRFTVLVPHYNKIRRGELSVVCKIEKISGEGNVASLEAVLWASLGGLEKRALISAKGNGAVKVIF